MRRTMISRQMFEKSCSSVIPGSGSWRQASSTARFTASEAS